MDKILLEGIRLEIRVGTTEEERSQPQLCGLDLTLEADLKAAGRAGDLKDTVDYAAIFHCIEAHCSKNSFSLLEEVGQQICDSIFDKYPVQKLRLRIRKLSPFSSRLTAVGVELKRSRKQHKKSQH
ncbi:MAG: dihydroneopterin aldolase [Acidobacteria bacterium]|nr:dihydroneopterin aldolase [Acidobacteriota bacterium]